MEVSKMSNKELFVKAHEMTKKIKKEYPEVDYMVQFSLCLTYLQEGEKEMVELKGTEKQIKWATEIRNQMVEAISIVDGINSLGTVRNERMATAIADMNRVHDELEEKINNETKAEWFINHRFCIMKMNYATGTKYELDWLNKTDNENCDFVIRKYEKIMESKNN